MRVAAICGAFESRDFAALTPQVRLSGVVVVGQADRRAVLDDLAEVAAEFQPCRVVAVLLGRPGLRPQ
ncbi:MAG: hypothetical protein AAF236_06620, partial [Verrucomicrobiota bacterium]